MLKKTFGDYSGGSKERLTIAQDLPEWCSFNEKLGVYVSESGVILQPGKVERGLKPRWEVNSPEFTEKFVEVLGEMGLVAVDDTNAVGGFHIWPRPENEDQAKSPRKLHASGTVRQDHGGTGFR